MPANGSSGKVRPWKCFGHRYFAERTELSAISYSVAKSIAIKALAFARSKCLVDHRFLLSQQVLALRKIGTT
jgi:hypothetical protein